MNPHQAVKDLVEVCRNKSGQGYKIRGMLFSLWNGKPYPLIEVVSLDAEIRVKLVIVITAFGRRCDGKEFFYDAISEPFKAAGLFDWFTSESEVKHDN